MMILKRHYSIVSGMVTFDTNHFVKKMIGAGLNTDAASTLNKLMAESLTPIIQETLQSSVSRSSFEKVCISCRSIKHS